MIPKNSRRDQPVEGIYVDEDLTTCLFCDTRTVPDEFSDQAGAPGYQRVQRAEVCPHCGQRYAVMDEQDDPVLVELRIKPRPEENK